jgi:hypothetical protein
MLVLVIRNPGALTNATFWAEDGAVFFLQSYLHGGASISAPYAGYHHFALRLISQCLVLFPIELLPLLFSAASIVLVSFVCVTWTARALNLPRAQRYALALAIPLLPHTGEVFYNVTNLQWILATILIFLLLSSTPASSVSRAINVVLGFAIGLTGVFSILFLPFFLLSWLRERNSYRRSLLIVVVTCACIQTATLATTGTVPPTPLREDASFLVIPWRLVWPLIPFGGAFTSPYSGTQALVSILVLVVVSTVIVRRRDEWRPKLLITASLLLVAAIAFRFRGALAALEVATDGDRYFWLPRLFLVWSILFLVPFQKRYAKTLVLLASLLVVSFSWRFETHPPKEWKDYAKRMRTGEAVVVPINPDGIEIQVPPTHKHQ